MSWSPKAGGHDDARRREKQRAKLDAVAFAANDQLHEPARAERDDQPEQQERKLANEPDEHRSPGAVNGPHQDKPCAQNAEADRSDGQRDQADEGDCPKHRRQENAASDCNA